MGFSIVNHPASLGYPHDYGNLHIYPYICSISTTINNYWPLFTIINHSCPLLNHILAPRSLLHLATLQLDLRTFAWTNWKRVLWSWQLLEKMAGTRPFGGFHTWGYPNSWMVKKRGYPTKNTWFRGTPISGKAHLRWFASISILWSLKSQFLWLTSTFSWHEFPVLFNAPVSTVFFSGHWPVCRLAP